MLALHRSPQRTFHSNVSSPPDQSFAIPEPTGARLVASIGGCWYRALESGGDCAGQGTHDPAKGAGVSQLQPSLATRSVGPAASCSKHSEDVPHFPRDTRNPYFYAMASDFRMSTTKSNL